MAVRLPMFWMMTVRRPSAESASNGVMKASIMRAGDLGVYGMNMEAECDYSAFNCKLQKFMYFPFAMDALHRSMVQK